MMIPMYGVGKVLMVYLTDPIHLNSHMSSVSQWFSIFVLPACRFMCSTSECFVDRALEQMVQMKGFSPVCMR